jgi:hypothetical protein
MQRIDSHHTTEEEAENLLKALEWLAGPEEMGARYKVLAIAREKAGICFACAQLARACISKTASERPSKRAYWSSFVVAMPHSQD